MRTFGHTNISGSKSDVLFEFSAPVYKDAVISGAWRHFRRLLCICALSTLGPNRTSGRKFGTGNEFSDRDFLQDANISHVNQRLKAL